MTPVRLIALAGVSGSGKDAAGSHLVAHHGFVRVAVADPIKETMMSLFGLSREQLWGDARNRPDPRLGRAPRELYQAFGKTCREIDPDVWVRGFRRSVETELGRGNKVVCTDLRMVAEMRVVRELGGVVWRIVRRGAGAPGTLAMDVTETALAAEPADLVIRNAGTLAELHATLSRAITAAVHA